MIANFMAAAHKKDSKRVFVRVSAKGHPHGNHHGHRRREMVRDIDSCLE